MSDLVKRLRTWIIEWPSFLDEGVPAVMSEAADALEAYEAKLKVAVSYLEYIANYDSIASEALARIKEGSERHLQSNDVCLNARIHFVCICRRDGLLSHQQREEREVSYKPATDKEIEWEAHNGFIKSARIEEQCRRANRLEKALRSLDAELKQCEGSFMLRATAVDPDLWRSVAAALAAYRGDNE